MEGVNQLKLPSVLHVCCGVCPRPIHTQMNAVRKIHKQNKEVRTQKDLSLKQMKRGKAQASGWLSIRGPVHLYYYVKVELGWGVAPRPGACQVGKKTWHQPRALNEGRGVLGHSGGQVSSLFRDKLAL